MRLIWVLTSQGLLWWWNKEALALHQARGKQQAGTTQIAPETSHPRQRTGKSTLEISRYGHLASGRMPEGWRKSWGQSEPCQWRANKPFFRSPDSDHITRTDLNVTVSFQNWSLAHLRTPNFLQSFPHSLTVLGDKETPTIRPEGVVVGRTGLEQEAKMSARQAIAKCC